ncbi:MAG: outer-membrane immunogenic protein precursor [Methylocystis sp.]|nr:MAG: outer-membrane immunogenic protein precursor [Methylocystis sp.]
MKKIALSVAALALTAGSALAADLPSRKAPPMLPPPPPPPPMWTGFYVGLNAGGTWANSSNTNLVSAPVTFNTNVGGAQAAGIASAAAGSAFIPTGSQGGFIGGGQFGYNWQFYNSFVLGFEADIQGIAGTSGSNASVVGAAPVPGIAPVTAVAVNTANASLDYLGTARGRLGWLFTPTLLLYGTGGLAYGGVTSNVATAQGFINQANVPGFFGGSNFSGTQVGWTAGGGVEWMFMPNWSAKVEYLYYDLGTVTQNFAYATVGAGNTPMLGNVVQATHRFNGNVVRAGLNYHFNWASAPVVAKY